MKWQIGCRRPKVSCTGRVLLLPAEFAQGKRNWSVLSCRLKSLFTFSFYADYKSKEIESQLKLKFEVDWFVSQEIQCLVYSNRTGSILMMTRPFPISPLKFPEDVMQASRMTEKRWEIETAVDVEVVPEDIGRIGLGPDRGLVDLSPDHKGTQDIMMTETKEVAPTPGNVADLLHLDTDSGLIDLGPDLRGAQDILVRVTKEVAPNPGAVDDLLNLDPDHKGAQDIMVNVTKEVVLTPGAVDNLLHVIEAARDMIQ